MKTSLIIAAFALLFSGCARPCPEGKEGSPQAPGVETQPGQGGALNMADLVTLEDKVSYIMGYNMSKDFNINLRVFQGAIEAQKNKAEPLLSEDDMRAAMSEFQTQRMQKMMNERKAKGEEALKRGQAFLEKNKAEPGVVTLESGLQYKVIKEGEGPKPTASDTVLCNYKGTLIDGTEFDSSAKHGKPAEFNVSGVIRGWTEALQLMPVGSKWQLFIPSSLAYGEMGGGQKIGPNETLIFEIELLEIKPAPEPSATQPGAVIPGGRPTIVPQPGIVAPQPGPGGQPGQPRIQLQPPTTGVMVNPKPVAPAPMVVPAPAPTN